MDGSWLNRFLQRLDSLKMQLLLDWLCLMLYLSPQPAQPLCEVFHTAFSFECCLMAAKRELRSRQWSCSSLANATEKVMAAKTECPEDDDEAMSEEIKAHSTTHLNLYMM